ncbi:cytochrome c maturation protein CcmE [Paracoccus fistulariae]|uniref:Cytochrome c-type biogenesis protein CcmE n=1 Tax=Paracoccus fistulariae TaxID=658446 RepID=A0ABY7SSF7_9RHOB|nr:cytochrome c maturation protein CcmE [Paracoccus fistulariae]MDB6181574.1 cytochrome c maturation protein CcmE [Paracoccus fistulariae]WCR08917.1 cytochrome c maturation protein CcmE [Paracoccus fistulariae]
MKSLKKRRRIQVLMVAAIALALSVALIGFGFRDGINLYRSPTQVTEKAPDGDEYFQLGGLVKEGSIVNRDGVAFDFVITDGAVEIPVSYLGRDPRPDLFTEGQGTIAKGYYRNGRFEAQDLLAKHDETYMPREVVDTLKESGVYQDPNG